MEPDICVSLMSLFGGAAAAAAAEAGSVCVLKADKRRRMHKFTRLYSMMQMHEGEKLLCFFIAATLCVLI